MPKAIPIAKGDRYGYLTVTGNAPRRNNTRRCACRCDCGNTLEVYVKDMANGRVKSCGCMRNVLISEKLTKHGYRNHPLYKVWQNMVARCTNQKSTNFKWYGGSGIRVCREWRRFPDAFIEWALENGWKPDLDVDRRNNKAHYSPDNCRCISHKKNTRNHRATLWVVYRRKRVKFIELVEQNGAVSYMKAYRRYFIDGWPLEEAIQA